MAAVTYDGVPSAEGGNIFRNMKFWLGRRVPSRKTLEEKIKANGGQLVPLEKQADMLIADHAMPKFAPSGSYSWKFIEDSITHGYLQVSDKYLIGLPPDHPRPAGGGGPTKKTRTGFTASEDAALAKWALSHQYSTGNKIFQEYENINPRHTWQSWRNRFVKHLLLLPKEKLQQLADSAPEQPDSSPKKVDPAPTRKPVEPKRSEPIVSTKKSPLPQRETRSQPEPIPQKDPKPAIASPRKKSAQAAKTRARLEPSPEPVAEPPANPRNETYSRTINETQNQVEIMNEAEESDPVRTRFYEDLELYIAATGVDIKPRPKINNITIELFDLCRAISLIQEEEDSQALDEMYWTKVAVFLGFDSKDDASRAELCQCYEEYLAEFIEFIEEYDAANEEAEAGHELAPEPEAKRSQVDTAPPSDTSLNDQDLAQLQEGEWEEESPSRHQSAGLQPSYARSSPPVRFKRNLDELPFPSSGPATKRTRYGKKTEIPSTPDIEGRQGQQVLSTELPSPSIRKTLVRQDYVDASEASQHLPPLPPLDEEVDEEEEIGEEGVGGEEPQTQGEAEMIDGAQSPPKITPQPSPVLGGRDTPADITPSQQLNAEALDPIPIPFSLDRAPRPKENRALGRATSYPMQSKEATSSGPQRTVSSKLPILQKPSPTKSKTKAPRRSLPASFTANAQSLSEATEPTASAPPRRTPSNTPRRPIKLESESNRREIDRWIKHYESLGFPRPIVVEGLKCTTLTPGSLAQLVMEKLQDGEDIPSHHEGIWTERDDNDLLFLKAVDLSKKCDDPDDENRHRRARKVLRRLVNKHGATRMELRKEFLEVQGDRGT